MNQHASLVQGGLRKTQGRCSLDSQVTRISS